MRRSLSGIRRHGALLAILIVALGLRCAYLPVNHGIVDQSGIQAEFAHNILDEGHWFAENTQAVAVREKLQQERHRIVDPAEIKYAAAAAHPHWHPFLAELPGPGLVLAAVWGLTGSERLIYGKVVQVAIDLAVLLLLYRVVLLLFARRSAALIAAALYAVCFPIARQTALVDPDIWAIYFTIAILALYLEAMRSPHRRRWLVACGLAVGVGALFRANVVLLPVVLGVACTGWPAGRPLPWPAGARPLRGALGILAVAALVLVPWTIRNYVEMHRFIPIRTGSGITLWEGLGEVHNNFGAVDNDLAAIALVHRFRPGLVPLSPAFDEYLQQRALRAIVRHPFFYVKLVGRRMLLSTVALYESAWMYRTGESPLRYRARTGKGLLSYAVNRPLELLESAYEPALFILGMLALLCTWRRYRREHLLLIAVLLSAFLPYWLLHFEARYVLPTLPIYLAWIGLGADLLGQQAARRLRARRSLRGALV
jgi:4-amino-4-deoxy-L-arabinose transferase-like glycosyltransferase